MGAHVDLGFRQFERDPQTSVRPLSMAILLAGATARQAASATAQAESRRSHAALPAAHQPLGTGAFNVATAAAIMNWKGE